MGGTNPRRTVGARPAAIKVAPSAVGIALVAALLANLLFASTAAAGGSGEGEDQAPRSGTWVAGDFHVHTCFSHDAYCGPGDDNTGFEDVYTFGSTAEMQFCSAAARGLDFVALSDHNDVRAQSDPGWEACGVLGIPAYENSLDGHAQMLGARRVYDNGDASVAAVQSLVERLHADGGAFQVNHPAEGSVDFPHDADWGYGYEVAPDSVEVWNISRLWQPPAPSASSNDDAVRYWEGWLDRGYRVAATGGSDNHWVSTSAVQGVGQPTTWVFAADRTWGAVVEAVKDGRTFIADQPPALGGPRLFLEADADGNGAYEAMVGDVVPRGSRLRVRVENATGSLLRVVTDGGREAFPPVPVTTPSFEHTFTLPASERWARAEVFDPDGSEARDAACDGAVGQETTYCRNQLLVRAMSSPIYFSAAREPTTLDYTGEERARGETVRLAAVLTKTNAEPVAGRTIVFEIAGQTLTARTDEGGHANADAVVPDHGRSQAVWVSFGGDTHLLPSEASATVWWGRPAGE